MNDWVNAGVAGFAATAPMTLAMDLLHRLLPPKQRYPLPPRQITTNLAARAGMHRVLDDQTQARLALVNHFGYGTLTGALYGGLRQLLRGDRRLEAPAAWGVVYGLGVWAGSYLGLLPATGLLSPVTRHPAERNALMIAAHVVWGAFTGLATEVAHDAAQHSPGPDNHTASPASRARIHRKSSAARPRLRQATGARPAP